MSEHTIPNASVLTGWRKSSYSGNDADSCVEVLNGHPSGVPVRGSKTPHRAAVVFAPTSWSSFITAIKARDLSS
ncbi:DUF397 domain-containing protein [Streptomyces goshikiensis]|uniref:DUF397 domain-containing protein n=1 Tax=Streptomyces goshikiensis TaxID=1942 RepID=UPI0036802AAE